MKFAVGYQLPDEGEEPLVAIVRDFRDHIEEVYFPCDKRCHACSYCALVFKQVLVRCDEA